MDISPPSSPPAPRASAQADAAPRARPRQGVVAPMPDGDHRHAPREHHRPRVAGRRGLWLLCNARAVSGDQHADLGLRAGLRCPVGGAAASGAARSAAGTGLRTDRRAGAPARRPGHGHAEHRPDRQPGDHILERRDGHEVGAVGAECRLRHDRAAGHRRLSAHCAADDAVRGGRGCAGHRGAGVPADGDLVRRSLTLQCGADQRVQHRPAGRAGRRDDRAAVSVRAVAAPAAQPAHISRAPSWPPRSG